MTRGREATKGLPQLLSTSTHGQVYDTLMRRALCARGVMDVPKKQRPQAEISFAEQGKASSPYPASYDDSRFRYELGWEPQYTIEDAVREHLDPVSCQYR